MGILQFDQSKNYVRNVQVEKKNDELAIEEIESKVSSISELSDDLCSEY